jgi:hypothetical protein
MLNKQNEKEELLLKVCFSKDTNQNDTTNRTNSRHSSDQLLSALTKKTQQKIKKI